ncbi:MAG: hypothetical protein JXR91_00005 [Deltaproteobacteria bacterium]|nr:hypothetical protein [Deltaproteobacteria bacterium]
MQNDSDNPSSPPKCKIHGVTLQPDEQCELCLMESGKPKKLTYESVKIILAVIMMIIGLFLWIFAGGEK